MGTTSDPYLSLYANTGTFKLEKPTGGGVSTWFSWVSDHELKDGTHRRSIAYWENGTNITGGIVDINATNTFETAWDPDVVELNGEEELLTVFYTIQYGGGDDGFPGNGATNASEYRLRYELFDATNVPSSNGDFSIQPGDPDEIEYIKTPNVDANMAAQACIVWEQMNEGELRSHIYAKTYDPTNGIGALFDLDPENFEDQFEEEYLFFYNPDVVVLGGPEEEDPDNLVIITFMGRASNGDIQLLSYTTTFDEIYNGNATSQGNLTVLEASMNKSSSIPGLSNDPRNDHFYRPRIAAHPDLTLGGLTCPYYSVVVPNIDVSTLGTEIVTYSVQLNCSIVQNVLTVPSSLQEVVNYEPAISVNADGYDVVWNCDEFGYMTTFWGGNTPINPTYSTAVPGDNILIRVNTDFTGTENFNPTYSIIPYTESEGRYAPSVAYEMQNMFGTAGDMPASISTLYGFHFSTGGSQNTYHKISDYGNQSLKRGNSFIAINDKSNVTQPELTQINQTLWRLSNVSPETVNIEVFDLSGKLIPFQVNKSGKTELIISSAEISQGTYIITATDPEYQIRAKLLVGSK